MRSGDLLLPAVAVPMEAKPKFECPPEQLALLRQALPHVTHILTIGWRGQDQRFVDELRSLLPKRRIMILCVGKDRHDALSVAGQLVFADTEIESAPFGGNGFSQLVGASTELDSFLRSAFPRDP
jgi:hypothetical protein